MKARYYIILCIVALMGSACERTLDFVNTQEEQANDMTIDAIAVEGTPLLVYLQGRQVCKERQHAGLSAEQLLQR